MTSVRNMGSDSTGGGGVGLEIGHSGESLEREGRRSPLGYEADIGVVVANSVSRGDTLPDSVLERDQSRGTPFPYRGDPGGRGEAHRRTADGGRDARLAARAARRGLPRGRRAPRPGRRRRRRLRHRRRRPSASPARPARRSAPTTAARRCRLARGRTHRRRRIVRLEFLACDGAALGLRDAQRRLRRVVAHHRALHEPGAARRRARARRCAPTAPRS